MASDPRRLEGPFLFVFADEERAPLEVMLATVDRWNHIKAVLGCRKAPHVTGHLFPNAANYIWMVENDDPAAAALPLNHWLIDRVRGNVVFCAANYEPLTREMLNWVKTNMLRP